MQNLNYTAAKLAASEYGLKSFTRGNGDFVITNRSGKSVFTFNREGELISKRSCYDNEIADVTAALNTSATEADNGKSKETKEENTWLVDGKSVSNNLNQAEMYSKYGMDFE